MFDVDTQLYPGEMSTLLDSTNAQSYLEDIRLAALDPPSELRKFFWWRVESDKNGDPAAGVLSCGDHKPNTEKKSFYLANVSLQGGGTLGLAHAGLLYGLEAAGIRFPSISGTSAGALVALGYFAARGSSIFNTAGAKIPMIVDGAPMDEFIDGPRPIRKLIKQMLLGHKLNSIGTPFRVLAAFNRLRNVRGLNHGIAFESWLQREMDSNDLATIADLRTRQKELQKELQNLKTKEGSANPFASMNAGSALKLMTAAMPSGVKFEMPEYFKYLDPQYESSSPALLVRLSMSVPIFFDPISLKVNRDRWTGGDQSFVEEHISPMVSRRSTQTFRDLDEITFYDGGAFSNLPFDAFDLEMPDFPTIAVPIVNQNEKTLYTKTASLASLRKDLSALVFAMKAQRDRDAYAQKKSLERVWQKTATRQGFPLVMTKLDTGDANWLNFMMSSDDKRELFEAGLLCARDFMKGNFHA